MVQSTLDRRRGSLGVGGKEYIRIVERRRHTPSRFSWAQLGAQIVVAAHPVVPAAAVFGGDSLGERLGLADLSPALPAKSAFLSIALRCPPVRVCPSLSDEV